MKRFLALLAVGVTLGHSPMKAQSAQSEAETLLASAKVIRCAFSASVRTAWRAGVPQPQIRTTGNLNIEFRELKPEQGSAGIAAGRNTRDITMVADEQVRYYYFVDAGGGKVTTTTVLGEFSQGMRLKAVHTIADFVALEIASFRSEPEVVQHMGDCEILP